MAGRMGNAILMKEARALFGFGVVRDSPDSEILERFLSADRAEAEAAFTVLVERHGPMVLHVCRQVLDNSHDAQDAFQATFVVFLRRAAWIRKRDSLASWLFGVALRVARRARYSAIVRRFHEQHAGEIAAARTPPASEQSVCLAALHEEIARLPERFREPMVICQLQGLSTAAAAQRLGCSQGTILSRLSRARERLRRRMTRRGLVVPAALFALSAVPRASAAALPPALVNSTVRATFSAVGGPAALAKTVTPSVALLTQTSMRALFMTRMTLVVSLTATAAVVAALTIPIVRPSAAAVLTALSVVSQSRPAGEKPRPDDLDRSVQTAQKALDTSQSLPSPGLAVRLKTDVAMTLAYAPDGRTLAAAGFGEAIEIYDVVTGVKRGGLAGGTVSTVRSVAFSPDGMLLASAGDDGSVSLWDVTTAAAKHSFPGVSESFRRAGHGAGVSALAFAPNGRLLATAAGAGVNPDVPEAIHEVKLFDLRTGDQVWSHMGRGESALTLAFAPVGEILATAGGPSIHLWNTHTGEPVRKLESKGGVFAVAYTPDGRTLAGGGFAGGGRGQSPTGFVTLWNVATGEVLHTLERNTGVVRAVAVSPDGKTVASGGDGLFKDVGNTKMRVSEVSLWEIATGKLLWTFEGEVGDLLALAFAPDGKTLAYSDQQAVGVIDARAGQRSRTLRTTTQTPVQ